MLTNSFASKFRTTLKNFIMQCNVQNSVQTCSIDKPGEINSQLGNSMQDKMENNAGQDKYKKDLQRNKRSHLTHKIQQKGVKIC